jgi:hypothetical protein
MGFKREGKGVDRTAKGVASAFEGEGSGGQRSADNGRSRREAGLLIDDVEDIEKSAGFVIESIGRSMFCCTSRVRIFEYSKIRRNAKR